MNASAPQSRPAAPQNEERAPAQPSPPLPCIECGYDLEGQFGDPVRCPECGRRATRAELASYDARPRRQLQKLESRIIRGLVIVLSLSLTVCLMLAALARVESDVPRNAAIVSTAVLLSILLASRQVRRRP
jgi:hypothetical protein